MTLTPETLNVDLWEAWVDLQSCNETNCPVLYVVGEVFTNDEIPHPYFIKKEPADQGVLQLEIKPGIGSEDGYVTEVLYAEELESDQPYHTILIYANGELVTEITDIEKFY